MTVSKNSFWNAKTEKMKPFLDMITMIKKNNKQGKKLGNWDI